MTNRLDAHNARVCEWASNQPAKYRKTALAFGYPCNVETASFTGTLEWVQDHARKQHIDISRPTLVRHLKVFREYGLIEVEPHRRGDKNAASTYTVHFDRIVGQEINRRLCPAMPDMECKPMTITGCGDLCDGAEVA
jgi:hypothetical protein